MPDDSKKCSCPFRPWEALPWVAVVYAGAIVLAMYLGGSGG